MRAQFRTRILTVLAVICFAAALIIVRLYFIQIVDGDDYARKADRQFASGASGLFDRGSIFFTRKDGSHISAATLVTGFLIAINPQAIENPETAYGAISAIASSTMTMTKEEFIAASAKKNQVYVEVAHKVPDDVGKALASQKLPGVQVLRERWRYYPGGTLASQAIGIVTYGSGTELAGQTGLEGAYDSVLSREGDALYKNFFAQLFSNLGNVVVDARDTREGDLITTIEPEVQTRLAEELSKVQSRYLSKETGGIIMNPATGEIIAMASVPTYDANNLRNVEPSTLSNPHVERVYEFGSIVKTLTMASGLDAGVITPETTYNDTGCVKVNKFDVCNWDLKARGVIPMKQVIMQSLNVGASWISDRLGQERFRTYFTKLFGEKTGIDQPAEGRALLSNLSTTQQVNFNTASFGQGIAVTPVRMIRALGALANNGIMVQPHLVSAIRLKTGVEKPLEWSQKISVFSPAATHDTASMMTEMVDEKLDQGRAKIPTMSVAAKTGTAQLTDGHGGYYKNRFFHSFTGFFPSYAPRFVILLYTNDPQGVQYASETLNKTFLSLVHFLIDYYAIPPDRGTGVANL